MSLFCRITHAATKIYVSFYKLKVSSSIFQVNITKLHLDRFNKDALLMDVTLVQNLCLTSYSTLQRTLFERGYISRVFVGKKPPSLEILAVCLANVQVCKKRVLAVVGKQLLPWPCLHNLCCTTLCATIQMWPSRQSTWISGLDKKNCWFIGHIYKMPTGKWYP